MPYDAERGRQCPSTLPIESYARRESTNSSTNNNSDLTSSLTSIVNVVQLQQGQQQQQQSKNNNVSTTTPNTTPVVTTTRSSSFENLETNNKEIHIEADESLVKSHKQNTTDYCSKRPFGGNGGGGGSGHTFTGSGGGDHSSASSFRSKRRSWHRRPRGGPYRPRGQTFDSHTTSSTGPTNAKDTSKTSEAMDQENSSEYKSKWFRHRLQKPYAAPPCNTTQVRKFGLVI